MRAKIVSDIHMEFRLDSSNLINVEEGILNPRFYDAWSDTYEEAEVLIIAGDFISLWNHRLREYLKIFLSKASEMYKYIIYVRG